MDKLRIIFMGTPRFALPSLQILIDRSEQIAAVVAQPDRPAGRGQHIALPPIKELALKHNLPVLQPVKVRDAPFIAQIKELSPDLIVVVAFGQILPRSLLDIPPYGCVNVHASLLPFYRGAAPINWVLLNGETETGVTLMLLDEGMDTGDMLLQEKLSIVPEDTVVTLHDRLAQNGARLLGKALDELGSAGWTSIPQDHAKATYAPLLKKEDGLIQWQKSAREIHNQIRGMNPWPGCFTYFNGKLLKVFAVEVGEQQAKETPGSIIEISGSGITVATGTDSLILKEIQLEGKKRLSVEEFVKGKAIKAGDILTGFMPLAPAV
jgi:methionyl-tRNA formyltransferase